MAKTVSIDLNKGSVDTDINSRDRETGRQTDRKVDRCSKLTLNACHFSHICSARLSMFYTEKHKNRDHHYQLNLTATALAIQATGQTLNFTVRGALLRSSCKPSKQRSEVCLLVV